MCLCAHVHVSLTHHSQFSTLDIQCPTLMSVCSGLMGGFLSIFFLIPVWLVCYAHGFHVVEY